jgi:hypothetical protein
MARGAAGPGQRRSLPPEVMSEVEDGLPQRPPAPAFDDVDMDLLEFLLGRDKDLRVAVELERVLQRVRK